MGYIFNQYNHRESEDIGFMTLVRDGIAKRRNSLSDSESIDTGGMNFVEECVHIPSGINKDISYYFHGKIKRMSTTQTFDIKLVNFTNLDGDEQYIKTIDIRKGNEDEWVTVEFIFTPAVNFDTIVFELRRIREDYSEIQQRFPIIIYEELSIINNFLPNLKGRPIELLKLGVQSHPGLMMCINSEQIYVGKTGIYELRNGVIKATMFSVVNPAKEDAAAAGGRDIKELQENLAGMGANPQNTTSICIFNSPKTRMIDAFTLDYMYESED